MLKFLCLISGITLLQLIAFYSQAQPIYTGNPIIDHFESADPHIAFVNNRYYLYPTDNTRQTQASVYGLLIT